jgi:hypothetical protein
MTEQSHSPQRRERLQAIRRDINDALSSDLSPPLERVLAALAALDPGQHRRVRQVLDKLDRRDALGRKEP